MDADRYWAGRAGSPRSKGVLASPGGLPLGDRPSAAPAQPPSAPVSIERVPPRSDLAHLVRHYWIVRWRLPLGTVVEQAVLEYPAANLVVEAREAGLYGPHRGRSSRRLEGEGWGVGLLLQPATARRLTASPVAGLVAARVDLGSLSIGGGVSAERLCRGIREAMPDDARTAVAEVERWLAALGIEPDAESELLAHVIRLAEDDHGLTRVDELAGRAGLGLRRLQRLVTDSIGFSPKWVIQRFRMQEAADRLAGIDPPSLAELAVELGFADQAHFSRDFRQIIGESPGRYLAALRSSPSVE